MGMARPNFVRIFLTGLNSPFGMELVGENFYVANTDSVWRFSYRDGQTEIVEPGVKIMDLPAGPINRHWTRNIIASQDGKMLYVTVGSNSNVGRKRHGQRAGTCGHLAIGP